MKVATYLSKVPVVICTTGGGEEIWIIWIYLVLYIGFTGATWFFTFKDTLSYEKGHKQSILKYPCSKV